MGWLGGKDKSQDQQIKEIVDSVNSLWKWIDQLNSNQQILVKNNNAFVEKNKRQAQTNQQVTTTINALVEKDKLHDAKDAEHDKLIQGLKELGKVMYAAAEKTEGG